MTKKKLATNVLDPYLEKYTGLIFKAIDGDEQANLELQKMVHPRQKNVDNALGIMDTASTKPLSTEQSRALYWIVYAYCKTKLMLTSKQLADVQGIGIRQAQRHIKTLKEKAYLVQDQRAVRPKNDLVLEKPIATFILWISMKHEVTLDEAEYYDLFNKGKGLKIERNCSLLKFIIRALIDYGYLVFDETISVNKAKMNLESVYLLFLSNPELINLS